MTSLLRAMWFCGLLAAVLAGCQNDSPRTATQVYEARDVHRDTVAAKKHNDEAVKSLNRNDLGGAEKELKAAIAADEFFGPAHNNLGLLYYRQKKFYQAAVQLQYAAKYMPSATEPRNNLGLVNEAAGKLDEAARFYEESLAINPADMQATGNLARVYVRLNRRDQRTRDLLREVAMKDSRKEWVEWARERLAVFGGGPATQGAGADPAK